MPDKRIYKIGQLVLVNLNREARPGYDASDNRRVKRAIEWDSYKAHTDDLVLARITGVKCFWEGKYNQGSRAIAGYGSHYEDYEQAYTTQDKQITVWGVRLGYKNKEIYFFPEDIQRLDFVAMGQDIPYFFCGPYSKDYRKKMSRESKDWPRDKHGKFSKEKWDGTINRAIGDMGISSLNRSR